MYPDRDISRRTVFKAGAVLTGVAVGEVSRRLLSPVSINAQPITGEVGNRLLREQAMVGIREHGVICVPSELESGDDYVVYQGFLKALQLYKAHGLDNLTHKNGIPLHLKVGSDFKTVNGEKYWGDREVNYYLNDGIPQIVLFFPSDARRQNPGFTPLKDPYPWSTIDMSAHELAHFFQFHDQRPTKGAENNYADLSRLLRTEECRSLEKIGYFLDDTIDNERAPWELRQIYRGEDQLPPTYSYDPFSYIMESRNPIMEAYAVALSETIVNPYPTFVSYKNHFNWAHEAMARLRVKMKKS